MDKSVVATLLNKTLGECQQLIVAKGWEHDEHTVTFPLTAANQVMMARSDRHCPLPGDSLLSVLPVDAGNLSS